MINAKTVFIIALVIACGAIAISSVVSGGFKGLIGFLLVALSCVVVFLMWRYNSLSGRTKR